MIGTNKDCISKQKEIEKDDSESDEEKLNEDKPNGEISSRDEPNEGNLEGKKDKPRRKRKMLKVYVLCCALML